MIGNIQMLAGLAVALGGIEAMIGAFQGRPKRIIRACLTALAGAAVWTTLGMLTGWQSPD